MDEFDGEDTQTEHTAGLFGKDLGIAEQIMLLPLQLPQRRRERGGVNGNVQLPQHIGYGADVVFVPVGEDDAADAGGVILEIGDVRQDHVDTVHVFIGKAHAAVHNDAVVAVFQHGHVLSDLAETAQGDEFQFLYHCNSILRVKLLCINKRG